MEKWQVKQKLDEELKSLKFTKQIEVLETMKQPTWREKLHAFWNKEITIPILPVSTAIVLLLFGYGYYTIEDHLREVDQNEIIKINGNMYWKDDIEGRISIEE